MTVLFNTHQFFKILEEAKFPKEQAEALTKAQEESFKEIVEKELATKQDISEIKQEINEVKQEIKELKLETNAQFLLLKWMNGLMLAGVASLIIKTFFV